MADSNNFNNPLIHIDGTVAEIYGDSTTGDMTFCWYHIVMSGYMIIKIPVMSG